MKFKKNWVKYCSISASVLCLFVSSPIITLPDTVKSHNIGVYDDCFFESKWEYGTHGWYFTLDEMKKVYEKEYEEGERLDKHIKIENGKYIAFEDDERGEVPKSWVKTTLKHLEQMLEKNYAKYIFRLDASHGHIFVPNERFDEYKDLRGTELISAYTKDKQLGILYHNSEHLTLKDKDGNIDPEAENLISKRSVLGWYDERLLEQTHPKEDGNEKLKEANTAGIPDGYHTIGNIHFKATKNGELTIRPHGKEIRIDISFDAFDYY